MLPIIIVGKVAVEEIMNFFFFSWRSSVIKFSIDPRV